MELIKNFVMTLITTLIFISAVEIIAPENGTKKYLKFVLGLILIAVILNPILKIISLGEESIFNNIDKFLSVSKDKNSLKQIKEKSQSKQKQNYNQKSFEKNLNKNIENLLEKEFDNIDFETDIKCFVDFEKLEYKITKIDIVIHEKENLKIKKIEKVNLDNEIKNNENVNSEYHYIIEFISEELIVDKKIIDIYRR